VKPDRTTSDFTDACGIDRSLVATLYRQHHAWLYDMVRRRLREQHGDAWDLVHDTFERLLKQPSWQAQDRPRGYLGAIAKRLLIDRHRRRAIEQAYLEAAAAQPGQAAPSSEAVAEMVEQLNSICETLDGMPARMRRVFILARMEGLPYGAIARQLNVSVNVVQKDMVQAWQRFYYSANG